MPKTLVVINHSHAGYRRAGIGLHLGRNELDLDALSPAQLVQLGADPLLTVLPPAADADPEGPLGAGDVPAGVVEMNTGTISGVVELDGTVRDLADMKLAELKALAKELEIVGYAAMKKSDLVSAIRDAEIQYPVADDVEA